MLRLRRVDGLLHGLRGDKWNQITDANLMVSVWEVQQPQGHREEGAVHLPPHQGQEGVCVPQPLEGKAS